MRHAFKEWAAVCRALAAGRQIVLLRKGGIAEESGRFRPGPESFLLLPTYLHQSADQLAPEAAAYLREAESSAPPPDQVEIALYAELAWARRVDRWDRLERIAGEHVWSPAVVRERFERWRDAGLYVLALRVFELPRSVRLPMRTEYGGCKSWVELAEDVPTSGSHPVLPGPEFERRLARLAAAIPSGDATG